MRFVYYGPRHTQSLYNGGERRFLIASPFDTVIRLEWLRSAIINLRPAGDYICTKTKLFIIVSRPLVLIWWWENYAAAAAAHSSAGKLVSRLSRENLLLLLQGLGLEMTWCENPLFSLGGLTRKKKKKKKEKKITNGRKQDPYHRHHLLHLHLSFSWDESWTSHAPLKWFTHSKIAVQRERSSWSGIVSAIGESIVRE